MKNTYRVSVDSYTPVYGFLLLILIVAVSFLLLIHSMVTSHGVPSDLFTDCVGGQVLDPVTHTCGGT